MAIVIDIDHEAGNLSEYDSSETDSGDLSAAVDAALAGTAYGLKVVVDDTTNIYGAKALAASAAGGSIRLRFYFDPNGFSTEGWAVLVWIVQTGGSYLQFTNIKLSRAAGGEYSLTIDVRDDANANVFSTDSVQITDSPHYVELLMTASTGADANDASGQWWIDGVSQGTYSSKDVFSIQTSQAFDLSFGAMYPTAALGTYYLDELVVRNDNTEIGPISTSASRTPNIVASTFTGKQPIQGFGIPTRSALRGNAG